MRYHITYVDGDLR